MGDETVLRSPGYGSQVSWRPVGGGGAMRVCQFVRLARRLSPVSPTGKTRRLPIGRTIDETVMPRVRPLVK
jgi:hypothetical protein